MMRFKARALLGSALVIGALGVGSAAAPPPHHAPPGETNILTPKKTGPHQQDLPL